MRDIQDVKNDILKNNDCGKFRTENIHKMLKITKREFNQHMKQMLNDNFLTFDGEIAYIINKEKLKCVKQKVVKNNNVICIHCINCTNKRYFNKYIGGVKHINVSCWCSLHQWSLSELESCDNFIRK